MIVINQLRDFLKISTYVIPYYGLTKTNKERKKRTVPIEPLPHLATLHPATHICGAG
jgi:hypothetical protein